MSSEEDVELKDLVAQALETNGSLAKIKAQLRASLFFSLHDDKKISNLQPFINTKIKNYLNSPEGKIMFSIVHEFLDICGLDFTLSVYEAESYFNRDYHHEERCEMVEELGLEKTEDPPSVPLLLEIIRLVQKTTNVTFSPTRTGESSLEECDNSVQNNVNSTFVVKNSTVTKGDDNINEETEKSEIDTQKSVEDSFNSKNLTDTMSFKDIHLLLDASESNGTFSNGVADEVAETDLPQSSVKDLKTNEKPKLSVQKGEKSKVKGLPDLSPLQHNKSRVTDILPSLYNKEFKEKSNLRELDKMFDMEVEYEEDFMCSGDDLSLKSYLNTESSKTDECNTESRSREPNETKSTEEKNSRDCPDSNKEVLQSCDSAETEREGENASVK